MNILHTYCLNYNLGDYALGIGLKNLLRKYLHVSQIGNANIQGREFNTYYINEVVNKRYDLLVIGGGGIIHGPHWPNGWFWLIDQDLIKEIEIPFIVYGVGNNYWNEEGGIPERGLSHLNETIRQAAYFSVRNDGSYERLSEQLDVTEVQTVPDPGFHVDLDREYPRTIDEPYVLIQLANDKPETRFGSLEKRQQFIQRMRKVTKGLAQRYKVIFSPHVSDDVSLSQQISRDIAYAEVWNFGHFAFDHVEEAVGYYKHAQFALSMRGHGQIVPMCFNTPVISLENHPKHRGLMEKTNLLDYNVQISNPDFIGVLNAAIERVEQNRTAVVERYQQINRGLAEDSAKAFAMIGQQIER